MKKMSKKEIEREYTDGEREEWMERGTERSRHSRREYKSRQEEKHTDGENYIRFSMRCVKLWRDKGKVSGRIRGEELNEGAAKRKDSKK